MNNQKELSAFLQVLLLAGLMIGGILLQLLLTQVMCFAADVSYADLISDAAGHPNLLKSLQIVQAICLFIVPGVTFASLVSPGNTLQLLKLDKAINKKTGIIIALAIITAIPFINLLGDINAKMNLPEALSGLEHRLMEMEEKAAKLTQILVSGEHMGSLIINLLMIAVLPAIGEEIIFRGIIQGIILKGTKNIHVAVWLAAFIFSAFHLQFYGFIPRFVLGIILGYLFVFSGSIWLPILAHFVNNAMATVFYYLSNNGIIQSDKLNTIGMGDEWQIGILSAAILTIIGVYLKRHKTELQLDESIKTIIT